MIKKIILATLFLATNVNAAQIFYVPEKVQCKNNDVASCVVLESEPGAWIISKVIEPIKAGMYEVKPETLKASAPDNQDDIRIKATYKNGSHHLELMHVKPSCVKAWVLPHSSWKILNGIAFCTATTVRSCPLIG